MTAALPISPAAPSIWRVPTVPGDYINSVIVRDDDGVTLIDTGLRGAPRRLLEALREIGSDPSEVVRILITHGHADHVGGLSRLLPDVPRARVAVHGDDADGVRSGQGALLDPSTLMGRLLTRGQGSDPARVDDTLTDGQWLPVGGGLRVIHTPGHSPGHVAFLFEQSRLLMTGDAIWNVRGRRSWPVLAFCTDVAMTQQTAHRLGELDYDAAVFTHGESIESGAREVLRDFLRHPANFRLLP